MAERINYASQVTEACTHTISSLYQQLMSFIGMNYWTYIMIVPNELLTKLSESCLQDYLLRGLFKGLFKHLKQLPFGQMVAFLFELE